jgi:arginyl-tRNA synthetase
MAKELRKSPQAIAAETASKINEARPAWLQKAEAAGPYVNFFLDRASFAESVIASVLDAGGAYGRSDIGAGKKVLVEYSSPNIAKYFHVGHLSTTMIGNSLSKILTHLGYDVVRMNYLGDWGTQFGKLITAYLKWGSREDVEAKDIDELVRLYVKFHEEAEKDASLEDEARAWVVRMQNGDEEGLALWRWFIELSKREYERIYKLLSIDFDRVLSESQYNDKMKAVAEELAAKGLLKESEGARIVDLEEYKMPPCLILRSDGGTLYPTRDIASAIERYDEYKFDKSLYVTGAEQILHFAQWMKVVELMGYPWAKDMEHISYGLFVFPEGKMSTRQGRVRKVEDLLNEAIEKTLEIIAEKNPSLPDKERVAKQVGVGAVIFNRLYNSRVKDVMFSLEKMINFDGETGPYVQYTHARACSVMDKAAKMPSAGDASGDFLTDDEAFIVLRHLYDYPSRITDAADKYEPFIIARQLVAIAQAYNAFYHNHTVLTEDEGRRAARLALTKAVAETLRGGLALLGIGAPERM